MPRSFGNQSPLYHLFARSARCSVASAQSQKISFDRIWKQWACNSFIRRIQTGYWKGAKRQFCYRPQRIYGKVIFSQACVKNSVHGGVSVSVHAGIHTPPEAHPREAHTHTQKHTPRWSLQRTVRILLECFLVLCFCLHSWWKSGWIWSDICQYAEFISITASSILLKIIAVNTFVVT